MKLIRKHLKPIALFLAVVFLVSSCRVYQTKTVSVDDALSTSKKISLKTNKNVKVKSTTNDIYKFKYLLKGKGQIYGVANKNSKTSKSLSNQIVQSNIEKNKVKILLTKDQVNEIRLVKEVLSGVLLVLSIVGGGLGIMVIGYSASSW